MERTMKKVLITGANSYIGTTFENWINKNCNTIVTETQDMRGNAWKGKNFGQYDIIFHVAGIAHADVGKVTEEQKKLYYTVNTDLTIECARKAKNEGVKQFIFMSSIIVYGEAGEIGKKKVITNNTLCAPASFYGDSKVKAEIGLQKLMDESFKVVILRPPMIYGKSCKGNYPLLSKLACKMPLFPDVKNERSMLYIGNLCKFIALMIENEENGIFFPQNKEYVETSEMVLNISRIHRKKICLTRLFNPVLYFIGRRRGKAGKILNKAFGNLVYDKKMSQYKEDYAVYDLTESIRLTEG